VLIFTYRACCSCPIRLRVRRIESKAILMPDPVCLIVDDEPAIRRFLRIILEQRQLQVLEAESAPQAFGQIQKLGAHLDLVLSDVQMGGDMDGVDLAHSIRRAFPTIRVILISGFCDHDAVAGFNFIRKPFTPETILCAVERALTSRADVVIQAGDER
jgi:DNA-binding NtrC family response regulator